MERLGAAVVVPRVPAVSAAMADRPMMSLTSTYLRNIRDVLPKGGDVPGAQRRTTSGTWRRRSGGAYRGTWSLREIAWWTRLCLLFTDLLISTASCYGVAVIVLHLTCTHTLGSKFRHDQRHGKESFQ
ncbi:hypothetical protein B0T26DRAFT_719520 [Lasiosphaeria miniovina]|uniref:Uncharacterized protein n=1 Tax=Lasiosphaeria miniovina TaxID=1954250 RepID=A0AA40ADZ4_9PEZI|nr:uncharacterized protein B0T26DRAFT_719520 [Lasiosphaeria miniovina]KAK0714098.1 hypothetical protein B0T26DRAFT_719520 [Lasiosphaeria miniovina]